MTSARLAELLRESVRSIRPAQASIDLAVIALPADAAPVAANVLFSREYPQGLVAGFDASGAVANVHFQKDLLDAGLNSVAWQDEADWRRLSFETLAGDPAHPRFVAPYPASLIKLMVLVGLARAIDLGRAEWRELWSGRSLREWASDMTIISCNEATEQLVARLHAAALLPDPLHAWFDGFGLRNLRLHDTRADGGWRNADGAGVGHLHMTAWDTARMLHQLDAGALLSAASRGVVLEILRAQTLSVLFPPGMAFAHKTGGTDNYASDAGIMEAGRCRYIVAMLSSLGHRHAQAPEHLLALGAALHTGLQELS